MRRLVLFAALAALAVGCADSEAEPDGAGPASTAAETTVPAPTPPPPPPPAPPPAPPPVQVKVVDGDTRSPVRRARVQVGPEAGSTNAQGVASVPLARPGIVTVSVEARGFGPRKVRVNFADKDSQTVRVYRPDTQWTMYGANPARTQVHPAITLRPPFRVIWSKRGGGLLEFPAVVWDGVAYLNNFPGYVQALSMRDGRLLWKTRIGTKIASSPALDPELGVLVTPTMIPGQVNVLDMRTGKVKWRLDTGLSEPSPVIRDGIAYVAATNGNVYALDLRRQRVKWVHSGGSKITGSPALVGTRLYVGDYAGRVFALNARTGSRVWTGSAGSRVYGTTAVAGGRVFAPSVFSGLSALSARNGRLLWRIPVSAYLYSSPAVFRGRVYFATYSGVVYCASTSSGRILWSASAGGPVSGAVQVVAGVVYAGSFGKRITAWNWRTGRRVWSFPHGEYVPVSGNGGRLLLHGYSRVWAVEPKG
jgi:outer membrane protein assembly factor BamB